MNITDVTLTLAFMKMGVQTVSGNDPSLGKGVTGIYFGTEPNALLNINPRDIQIMEFAKYINEARAIEQQASEKPGTTSQEEAAWADETEDWLRVNIGGPSALQFRASAGFEAKKTYLLKINQHTFSPTPQQ